MEKKTRAIDHIRRMPVPVVTEVILYEWSSDILAALTPEELKAFNEQLNVLDGLIPTADAFPLYRMTDPDGNVTGYVPDLRSLSDW